MLAKIEVNRINYPRPGERSDLSFIRYAVEIDDHIVADFELYGYEEDRGVGLAEQLCSLVIADHFIGDGEG